MILGIDAGNHEVKVMGPYGPMKFLSDIGEFRERRLEELFGNDDMAGEYKGRKFFAGSLARYESEFVGSMMGDTKAHDDTLLRVLLAIHRYTDETNIRIVVGQPISSHLPDQKQKIEEMIIGKHTLKVNGIEKTFSIPNVRIGAEGAAAFASVPIMGLVRIIDVGSGTVNCATIMDGRFIDQDSFTLTFGANTTKSEDKREMSRAIATQATKKWGRANLVLLAGGFAEEILPYISQYFPNNRLLRPRIQGEGAWKYLHPVYANACGFYEIARKVYGKEN